MGLLERIKNLIAANLNELLEKAEDPDKVLTQLIEDMEEELDEAKIEVARVAREERRLYEEYADNELQGKQMGKKAVLAVERGEDELAREALRRKRACERRAESLKQQWQAQKQSVDALRLHLDGLERKIEEARQKKALILARRQLATARSRVSETDTKVTAGRGRSEIDRMEDRVEDLEAEAEAMAALTKGLLESRFERLNGDQSDEEAELDQELEEIRKIVEEKRRSAGKNPQ